MERSLQLAHERVEPIASELGISEMATEDAIERARLADYEYPMNRSPSGVAAASIYLTALLHNEKRTQPEVADAADVSVTTIREIYTELAEYEGIQTNTSKPATEAGSDAAGSWIRRIREVIR